MAPLSPDIFIAPKVPTSLPSSKSKKKKSIPLKALPGKALALLKLSNTKNKKNNTDDQAVSVEDKTSKNESKTDDQTVLERVKTSEYERLFRETIDSFTDSQFFSDMEEQFISHRNDESVDMFILGD